MPRKRKCIKRKKYSSLLVIGCDSAKLESQSIDIAKEINDIFTLLPFCRHAYICLYNESDLRLKFSNLAIAKNNYDIILLVGHSVLDKSSGNPIGIKMADDYLVKWNILHHYLYFLKPKCLVLATCKGGHFLPSKILFSKIPSLKELYGSPVIVNQAQISIMKLLIPYIILTKADPEILEIGNILNYLITGGIILKHSRSEYEKGKPPHEMQQLLYELLLKLHKKLK